MEKEGITLLEFLLYILLAGIIFAIIFQGISLFLLSKERLKAKEIVDENLEFALEKVERSVRFADKVIFPEVGNSSSTLILLVNNRTTTFYLEDGILKKKVGRESPVPLTTNKVIVSPATTTFYLFTHIKNPNTPPTISIKMKVKYLSDDPRLSSVESKGETTVSLRLATATIVSLKKYTPATFSRYSSLTREFGSTINDYFLDVSGDENYLYVLAESRRGALEPFRFLIKFSKADLSLVSFTPTDKFTHQYEAKKMCSDSDHLYFITNASVVKYEKATLSPLFEAFYKIYKDGDYEPIEFFDCWIEEEFLYLAGKGCHDQLCDYKKAFFLKVSKEDLRPQKVITYRENDWPDSRFVGIFKDSNYFYLLGERGSPDYAWGFIVKIATSTYSLSEAKAYYYLDGAVNFKDIVKINNDLYIVGENSQLPGQFSFLMKLASDNFSSFFLKKTEYGSVFRKILFHFNKNFIPGEIVPEETSWGRGGLIYKLDKDFSIISRKRYWAKAEGGDLFRYSVVFYSGWADGNFLYLVGKVDEGPFGGRDAFIGKFHISLPPGSFPTSPSGYFYDDVFGGWDSFLLNSTSTASWIYATTTIDLFSTSTPFFTSPPPKEESYQISDPYITK